MKNFFLTLVSITLLIGTSIGQKTDLSLAPFIVPRPELKSIPSLTDYPYLAVSVLFRNFDKLSNKDFLGKLNKMDFFYAEVSITYDGRIETSPLYFLKRDKGQFSTNYFVDKTVVRKIPIKKYSDNIPSIGINLNTKIINKPIAIVKAITDKVTPIIQNPTSIYGQGAPQLVYSFFNNIVNQLSESKVINAGVNYDGFNTDELGILPHSYNAVILGPGNVNINGSGLIIKKDVDSSLKLFKNNTVYDEYPYFIIQIGLSNKLDVNGLPSRFYDRKGSCDINQDELNKLTNDFNNIKHKLSDSQLAAEENLLKFYQYKLDIINGVNAQGASPDAEKLLCAYNALYDFRSEPKRININTTLRKEHYDSYYNSLTSCIYLSANSLSIYKHLVEPLFKVIDKQSDIDNADLSTIRTYIENTKKLDFILNSKFHSTSQAILNVSENKIYKTKFEGLANSIAASTVISEQLTSDMASLVVLKNEYNNCRLCLDEAQIAEKKYTELVNNQELTRNQISEIVRKANETYTKGVATFQRLEFVIAKTYDTLSNVSELPNDILFFKSNLQQAMNNLKTDKENLNIKFSLPNFTKADQAAINAIITTCNASMWEINEINDKLIAVFENNKSLFTSL